MSIYIPHMNPVRYRKQSTVIDYSTIWPNYENISQRVNYYVGMNASQYYKDFIINSPISVQFQELSLYDRIIYIYKYNNILEQYQVYGSISGTDITPTGWISSDIYKYTWTPTESGVYYFNYLGAGIVSDEIVVHSLEILKKQLVQVTYYNSENDYGMVFYDNTTLNYTGTTYFTGLLQNYSPSNQTTAYTNDRGGYEILRASPVHGSVLSLTNIHHSYIENINMIFSCDNVSVNGINYSRDGDIEISDINKSDLVDIKIKLKQKIEKYYAEA